MRVRHSAPLLGSEEQAAAARVLASGRIAQGPEVEAFEGECAEAVGRRHAVATNTGTSALHLALAVLGVEEDSLVGVPSYACSALTTAVRLQRATAYLGDIDGDYNLDGGTLPDRAAFAILPHLFGKRASIPRTGIVVEDIAQSMGGGTGRATAAAITSFYATKLMTTGEGGMLFTDDEGVADAARDLRETDKHDDFTLRFNYKMTDLQAAIGREQLKRLPSFLARRREIAEQYTEAFSGLPLRLPTPNDHVYYRYVVACEQRDALEKHLGSMGVEAKRPVHRPAHRGLDENAPGLTGGPCPRSDQAHRECLSIPLYPALDAEEIDFVIGSTVSFFEG